MLLLYWKDINENNIIIVKFIQRLGQIVGRRRELGKRESARKYNTGGKYEKQKLWLLLAAISLLAGVTACSGQKGAEPAGSAAEERRRKKLNKQGFQLS